MSAPRLVTEHDPDDPPAAGTVALQVEVDAALPVTWLVQHADEWKRMAA